MALERSDADRWREQLHVLSEAMRGFAEATASPQVLIETVTRRTAEALRAFCRFAVVSSDEQWLVPVATFDGLGGDVTDIIDRLAMSNKLRLDAAHPLASSIASGHAHVIPRFTDEQWRAAAPRVEDQDAAIALDIHGIAFVPLHVRGKTIGAFSILRYGDRAAPFDDTDILFAEQMASHAALAIVNSRQVEASNRQADRLRFVSDLGRELAAATGDYGRLVELIASTTGSRLGDCCVIRIIAADGTWLEPDGIVFHRDPALQAIIRAETLKPQRVTEGLSGRAIAAGRAVMLPKVEIAELAMSLEPRYASNAIALQIRSIVSAPLRSEGRTIGAVLVTRSDPAQPFEDDDLQLLDDIASHASIAITNAKLLVASRRVEERLRILSTASKEFVAATGDVARLLDMVTRTLSEAIGGLCALRLLTEDGTSFEPVGSVHHPDPAIVAAARAVMSQPEAVGVGVSGGIAATGKPVLINAGVADEVADQVAPRYQTFMRQSRMKHVIGVPLFARSRVIGVITLSREDGAYAEDDLLFVQDLASHAGLAIKTGRLLASLQHELAQRKRAEDALSRTQDQLRQAQKMEAVGRLAGGVAHDFNNLLSVVLCCCQFMSDALRPNDPMREDLEQIKRAGERAADLTRQLLAFSRQQVIEPQILDLDQVVRGMEKMLERLVGEDVEVQVSHPHAIGKVLVDPGHVEQVIMNLVVNARDAMPDGGTIVIETANVELDEAYALDHLGVVPGPHVMLAISDTGLGMDRETQQRIFEPFFTTKEKGKGTGLGLSTVFGIVQQSRGSIWVYSEPGKGTTFKVYLPRTDQVERARQATGEIPTLRGSETILLVEDDDQVRLVARGILKRGGYKLLEARNGGEALLLCEKHAGAIDLLLTDVVMPNMSGRELSERLLRIRSDLKVLYMSGYTEDAILHHRVVAPGIALLQKPLTPDALLRKVRTVLDQRPDSA